MKLGCKRVGLGLASLMMVFCAFFWNERAAHAQVNSALIGVQDQGDVPPHYYGLGFDITAFDSTGLNSVGQNYRNDLGFVFSPRWGIGQWKWRHTRFQSFNLSARFVVNQNLSGVDESNFSGNLNTGPIGSCSNLTPSPVGGVIDPTQVRYCNPPGADRRTDYSDFSLIATNPRIYVIPKLGININPTVRVDFPASVQSRFATLVLSTSATLGLLKTLAKGKVRLGYSFAFRKNFHQQNTPRFVGSDGAAVVQGNNPYDPLAGQGLSNFYSDPTRTGTSSGQNTNFSLSNFFSAGFQLHPKVSLDIFYIITNAFAYSQSCEVVVNGVVLNTCTTGDLVAASSGSTLNRPGRRDSQFFYVGLSYNPFDYLSLGLAWLNTAPLYNLNGSYRQGIISTSYDAFTSVQLSATVSLESVADVIRSKRAAKQAQRKQEQEDQARQAQIMTSDLGQSLSNLKTSENGGT